MRDEFYIVKFLAYFYKYKAYKVILCWPQINTWIPGVIIYLTDLKSIAVLLVRSDAKSARSELCNPRKHQAQSVAFSNLMYKSSAREAMSVANFVLHAGAYLSY